MYPKCCRLPSNNNKCIAAAACNKHDWHITDADGRLGGIWDVLTTDVHLLSNESSRLRYELMESRCWMTAWPLNEQHNRYEGPSGSSVIKFDQPRFTLQKSTNDSASCFQAANGWSMIVINFFRQPGLAASTARRHLLSSDASVWTSIDFNCKVSHPVSLILKKTSPQ